VNVGKAERLYEYPFDVDFSQAVTRTKTPPPDLPTGVIFVNDHHYRMLLSQLDTTNNIFVKF